jgi:hypothetical protein
MTDQWTDVHQAELERIVGVLECEPPVSDDALQELVTHVSATYDSSLPHDYVAFLRIADGADGDLESGAPILFWKAELLAQVNEEYESAEQMPGLLVIGSDAGDLVYGIDLRKDAPSERYVETEDVSMAWDYILWRGRTLLELLRHVNDHR